MDKRVNWAETIVENIETKNVKKTEWSVQGRGSRSAIGASLVAKWLRIRLPMQGTRVRAPVREDPTCRGAARSVSHNY